jgi:hypothetical protein
MLKLYIFIDSGFIYFFLLIRTGTNTLGILRYPQGERHITAEQADTVMQSRFRLLQQAGKFSSNGERSKKLRGLFIA